MANLREKLAASTREAHAALECRIGLGPRPALAQYAAYLRAMHAVVASAEACIVSDTRLERMGLALGHRRKLGWLESDLRALRLAPLSPRLAPRVAEDAPARVGWAYVLEGSALGGRVMLKQVAPPLGLTAEHGATFLAGYGAQTPAMWRSFVDALNAIPFGAAETQACVAGAAQAFAAIAETFRAASVARAHLGVDGDAGRGLAP